MVNVDGPALGSYIAANKTGIDVKDVVSAVVDADVLQTEMSQIAFNLTEEP